jgi:hypothetical protein
MPVRKIPRNHMRVTGAFATAKSSRSLAFESTLEREYMLLLEFDERVSSIEEQPVRIPVPGIPRGYVPDVLVKFHPVADGSTKCPELVEVKHTSDLSRNQEKYKAKFDAAHLYAHDQGWLFQVVTEKEVRTPRLHNLFFLRGFTRDPIHPEHAAALLACVRPNAHQRIQDLIDGAAHSLQIDKLNLIRPVWALVASKQVHVDLEVPLTFEAKIAVGRCDGA